MTIFAKNLDTALVNYAARLACWLQHRDTASARLVEQLAAGALEEHQKRSLTLLFQINRGLLVDGIAGPQVRLELERAGLLRAEWKPNDLEHDPGEAAGEVTPLSAEKIRGVASEIGISEAKLRAVIEVESAGGGYTASGLPKILFEGHLFYYYLNRAGRNAAAVARANPSICYPRWTKAHYLGGDREWDRLILAAKIAKEEAYKSASYGLFQLVAGFHATNCGYRSAEEMASTYLGIKDENIHLADFMKAAGPAGWLTGLQSWEKTGYPQQFVRSYNGPGQVDYYSRKLLKAEHSWELKLAN